MPPGWNGDIHTLFSALKLSHKTYPIWRLVPIRHKWHIMWQLVIVIEKYRCSHANPSIARLDKSRVKVVIIGTRVRNDTYTYAIL